MFDFIFDQNVSNDFTLGILYVYYIQNYCLSLSQLLLPHLHLSNMLQESIRLIRK